MGVSITAAANVYCESNSLPGWLEMASAFADDILVIHAGPAGKLSTDGTLEILEKWRVRVIFDEIDKGFGEIRTRLLRECRTDYCAILDADERLHRFVPVMSVSGQPTPQEVVDKVLGAYSQPYDTAGKVHKPGQIPSNWENLDQLGLDLKVTQNGIHDQGAMLRTILAQGPDVIQMVRRHWHDFTWTRPTQDWYKMPDFQYRVVRCDPKIHFEKTMHESLVGWDPTKVYRAHPRLGPAFDHYHLALKKMEPDQRREDVAIYNALHEGRSIKPPEKTFLSGQGFTSEERERILAETKPPEVKPHVLELTNILGSKSAQAFVERHSGDRRQSDRDPPVEGVTLMGGDRMASASTPREVYTDAGKGTMRLLNIGAGGTLPNKPWINVDYPHEHPEMDNYVRHDASKPLPFPDNWADGLIACHFLEHFECLKAVEILQEFYRVLKPGGVCRVVVPDASYHRKVYAEDLADPIGNAMRLFGEPLAGRDRAKQKLEVGRKDKDDTFMSFALFWADHKQLFTEDSLWCELVQAGFAMENIFVAGHQQTAVAGHSCSASVAQLDNRPLFSLRMEAVK